MDKEKEIQDKKLARNSNLKALTGTLILLGVFFLLFITLGFKVTLPLPGGNEGIEVALGEDEKGMNNFGDVVEQNIQLKQNIPAVKPKVEKQNNNDITDEDIIKLMTQETDDAPSIKNKKEKEKKTKIKKEEEERVSNPLFEYTKNQKSKGKGDDKEAGNKGNKNGTPNSDNYGMGGKGKKGTGTGASGSNGTGDNGDGNLPNSGGYSYNLKGRKLLDKPNLNDESQIEAKIVIKIQVDRNGRVVDAEVTRGSSMTAGLLVEKAKKAARELRFSEKKEAPESQEGTITFNLKLK